MTILSSLELGCSKQISPSTSVETTPILWVTKNLPELRCDADAFVAFPAVFALLHEGLVKLSLREHTIEVEPGIADSWSFSQANTLIMKLRSVRSLDGHRLDAETVANDLRNRLTSLQSLCSQPILKNSIPFKPDFITAHDLFIEFRFHFPAAHFLHALGCPELWPTRLSGSRKPILNGPFHLTHVDEDGFHLSPNPFFRSPLDLNLQLILQRQVSREKRNDLATYSTQAVVNDISSPYNPTNTSVQVIKRVLLMPTPDSVYLVLNGKSLSLNERNFLVMNLDTSEAARLTSWPDPTVRLTPSKMGRVGINSQTGRPGVLHLSYPENLKPLAKNIAAQFNRLSVKVFLEQFAHNTDLQLVSHTLNPLSPYEWPNDFPKLAFLSFPLVLHPTPQFLSHAMQEGLESLIREARLVPVGRFSTLHSINVPNQLPIKTNFWGPGVL